jgi:uncharacterized protein
MAPTEEEIDDVLLAARYGEDDDVKTFTTAHGIDALAAARDDNGNTVLHMAAANGHTGKIPTFILLHRPKRITI